MDGVSIVGHLWACIVTAMRLVGMFHTLSCCLAAKVARPSLLSISGLSPRGDSRSKKRKEVDTATVLWQGVVMS
jgi:hypothetical protein